MLLICPTCDTYNRLSQLLSSNYLKAIEILQYFFLLKALLKAFNLLLMHVMDFLRVPNK